MYYEIIATDPKAPRTTRQKLSPFYSEAPSVGGKTLRRGSPLKMSVEGFKHLDIQLKRFLDAGAIEIYRVHPDGRREPVRSIGASTAEVEKLREEVRELEAAIRPEKAAPPPPAPPEPPEEPEVQEPAQEPEAAPEEPVTAVTAPAEETTPEPVQEETAPATVDDRKSKKQRRKE